VPVNAHARAALSEYLESRGEIASSEPLFITEQGERMKHYTIWYCVKKYARLAGIEKKVSPHTYRHYAATRLVRNPNVDIVTAAAFLGHSRIDTTARYAKPSDDDLARAAEQI
jgi:site-specific recombinase XerD